MLNVKYFLALALISIVSCDVEIPEKYWNAKPMSEHPEYKGLVEKFYPKMSESEPKNPFIIGGSPAVLGQIPYYALMFMIYSDDTAYICGGSIIHAKWVLTAAHCIRRDAARHNVYAGIVNITGPATWSTTVPQSDLHIHPQYNQSALRNDIAMVRMTNAPDDLLSRQNIGMIQLSTGSVNLVDMFGSIAGFGRTSDNSSSPSSVLKYNYLRVMSNERCAMYYVAGAIHETHLCGETNATASTCSSDNGGPYSFVINGVDRLEGITSFYAQSGCERGYPAGFTRVSSYLNWINDTINGRNPTDELWNELRDIQEQYLLTLQNIIEGAGRNKREKLLKVLKIKVFL